MREEVHLHAEGDQWRALDALAKRRGMSRSRLALGLVWEAWQRDIEGVPPELASGPPELAERAVELVMTTAVRLQDPARTGRLVVVEDAYADGVPVTVASSLRPSPEGTAVEVSYLHGRTPTDRETSAVIDAVAREVDDG